jgi:hypothetical protein
VQVQRPPVIRHDEPVVMRTLAFVVLRQIFGLVGCGRSPDVKVCGS